MTLSSGAASMRTAIVTGAGSLRGIGRATAHRLARDGWAVAMLDLDVDGASAMAAEVSAEYGIAALGLAVDVSSEASVRTAVGEIERVLPPVAGLANLAGISSPTDFLDVTVVEWDHVMAVNLRGVFLMAQAVLPGMVARRFGRIVSASSVSAQRGGGTYSKVAYSASKAGVIGLTRALAREVGDLGVTVNCVTPGPIDTDIMGGRLTTDRKATLSASAMIPRVGSPDEVAALVAFLMSDEAGYITAACYDINGGLHVS